MKNKLTKFSKVNLLIVLTLMIFTAKPAQAVTDSLATGSSDNTPVETNITFSPNKQLTNNVGFEENIGQVLDQNGTPNMNILFIGSKNGLNLLLRKDGFSYQLIENKEHEHNHNHDLVSSLEEGVTENKEYFKTEC